MMIQTKYQGSRPCGSAKKIFSCFPYVSLCKACEALAANFWPQEQNLNKLGRVPIGDATYQIYTR